MRIDEVEALPHQRLFVVENHAVEVDKRLGVDEDANIFKVVHTIPFTRLRVETNVIGETRAAAALDAQTEAPLIRGDPFFGHGYANPFQSALRYLDALLIRRGILRIEDGWFHLAFLVSNGSGGFRGFGYAVLLLPITNGRSDCIFRQHRAVNLDRR
jgi:hypothetical protein